MNTDARFPIGTRYLSQHRKYPYVCTVVDIHRTYNAAGVLVKVRYVATHDFCGQPVTESDIVDVTVARGVALLKESPEKAR
jgi:hypothetical protein